MIFSDEYEETRTIDRLIVFVVLAPDRETVRRQSAHVAMSDWIIAALRYFGQWGDRKDLSRRWLLHNSTFRTRFLPDLRQRLDPGNRFVRVLA